MLGSRDVVAFAATTDARRARAFYEGQLGIRLMREEPTALVFDTNGTVLRIRKVEQVTPAAHTVLGWLVPDIERTVRDLVSADVRIERIEGLEPDALGISTFANGDRVAWFKDPDGNLLSVTQLG